MDYNIFNWNKIKEFNISQYDIFSTKGKKYLNIPISFDIEVSSFYLDKLSNNAISINEYDSIIEKYPKREKQYIKSSLCYIWQFAIDNNVFIGRKLSDFVLFIEQLKSILLDTNIIVYVHNLSYEFQFIRKYFNWVDVFATDNRKVLFAKTDFIFFKCSYFLSGKSLEKLTNDIPNSDIKKLTGNLDYKLLRSDKTILSKEELEYCIYDVLIVNEYIKYQATLYNRLDKIPYTNTGRVRRYTRKECFKNKKYPSLIHKSLLLTPLEFKLARYAFQGGYTHASCYYTNMTCNNVHSQDLTSSYPTVMLCEKYPMSKGVRKDNLTIEQFEKYIEKYCSMVVVELWNVTTRKEYQPIISFSKCIKKEKTQLDNGRVYRADYLMIVITDVDYKNIKEFYQYEKIKIGMAYFYKKDYLPKEIIQCILKLYKDKTTLKDIKGYESEYLLSKGMLNSLYGMSVYNPIKTQYKYFDNWTSENKIINNETINEYNNDKSRFTFYLWGIFITSYARNNLFTGIKELKNDFIYCDTDSLKYFNYYKHRKYFIKYNNNIYQKLKKTLLHYNIDINELKPSNKNGVKKLIGLWEYEGEYNRFKTLGSKRYLTEKNNKLDLTVSGLNSKLTLPYLIDLYKTNDNIFDNFTNKLFIPKNYSGKKVHTYIDDRQEGIITDYQGNTSNFISLTGIHLIECEYDLNIMNDYLLFFKYIQNCANFV